jgi:hypothetical protein
MTGHRDVRDYSEGVILHDRRSRDTSEETLLHATFEAENGDLGRWDLNIHLDFTDGEPRDDDAIMTSVTKHFIRLHLYTHKMVMPRANQKSCWRMMWIPSGFHEWVSRS